MKLALLGWDGHIEQLVEAALRQGHEIVAAVGRAGEFDAAQRLVSGLAVAPQWEDLLLKGTADAVLVAGLPRRGMSSDATPPSADEIELRGEQLRRLTQEGVPLMLAHPAHPSLLLYFELDMIRRDPAASGAVIVPFIVSRFDPVARRLVEAVGPEERVGNIEQAVFTRETSARRREGVLARFASDVDLLREVCGDLKRLSAMGPSFGASDYATLGVQLSTEDGIAARWTLAPAREGEQAKLRVLGSKGSFELWMPDAGPWRLRGMDVDGQPRDSSSEDEVGASSCAQTADAAIAALEAAIAGKPAAPDVLDAARAMELADSIDRSLRRGRVIDLHYEELSEEATFKGHMTALGCGILLVSLVLLVVAAVAGRFKIGWLQFGAMAAILAMGVTFLALQFFGLAASKKPGP